MIKKLRTLFGSQNNGRNWQGTPNTIEVDENLAEEIERRSDDYGPIIFLVPYKREGGIEASRQFFRSVHQPRRTGRKGKKNVTPPFTLEMCYWQADRRIGFRYAAPDEMTRSEIRDELLSTYHDSNIEMGRDTFLDVQPGQYASIAHLRLRDPEYLKPINSYQSNPEDFRIDPYDGITSKMTGDGWGEDANVMVQIVLKPAISHADTDTLNWHHGSNKLAKKIDSEDMGLRKAAFLEVIGSTVTEGGDDVEVNEEKFQTGEMSEAAGRIANQANDLGYHLNVRIIAVSDDPDVATMRVQATAGKYRNFYNADYGQGFEPAYPDADGIRSLFQTAAAREWVDREMPMGVVPLMGVAHPPTYLNTQGVEWTFQQGDEGPPTSAPQFEDFDQMGYYNPDKPLQEAPTSEIPPSEQSSAQQAQPQARAQTQGSPSNSDLESMLDDMGVGATEETEDPYADEDFEEIN